MSKKALSVLWVSQYQTAWKDQKKQTEVSLQLLLQNLYLETISC